MRTTWWAMVVLPALVALAGCPAADDDDTGGDDDDSVSDVVLESTYPANGSTGPYYRDCLEATFSDAAPDATLTLEGPDGEVTGDLTVDGAVAGFCPDAPLSCETSYTVAASWDDGLGIGSWSFSTDELGCPIEGSAEGRVYAVDLAALDIVEPQGIGTLLSVFMTVDVLLQVESVGGGQIQMLGGMAADSGPVAQDECVPTFSPTQGQPGSWEDPFFYFEADGLQFLFMDEYSISVERLVMSGTFLRDLSAFEEGRFEALLDVRSVEDIPAVADLFGDTAICDFLADTLGVACEACDDGAPQCVYFLSEHIDAPEAAGVTLQAITAADVADDPDCTGD